MSEGTAGYFQSEPTAAEPDPSFPPVFATVEEIPFVTLSAGVRARPIIGRSLHINYVYFEPNAVAPLHQHSEEQAGTVLEGEMEFELNGERRILRPGDVYVAPPHVLHGARTYENGCVALDVFSPPRRGIRDLLEQAQD